MVASLVSCGGCSETVGIKGLVTVPLLCVIVRREFTTAFGSNSDGAFDAIATFYCRKTDKPRTPSNVVSHDVVFPTTTFSSILRRFKRGKRDVANVARPTFQTWQERRCKRGKTDVSNVAIETFANVARETLQTWQDRRFKRGN
jgi:hypothetical protein